MKVAYSTVSSVFCYPIHVTTLFELLTRISQRCQRIVMPGNEMCCCNKMDVYAAWLILPIYIKAIILY